MYGKKGYKINNDLSKLTPGTFYLTEVDSMWRRFYARNGISGNSGIKIGEIK
jgi:hydroxymethylglutaryl-CoA synthase